MKYRDPVTGNLELFPILKSIDHTELIKSVLTECNKIFEDYSIEPIDSLEKLPDQIKKFILKILFLLKIYYWARILNI